MFDVVFERAAGALPALGQWLRLGGAVLGTGVAVKLMDDHLDADSDRIAGFSTWTHRLGAGALPYSLLSLAVAALLQIETAAALFLGAYAAGMGHQLGVQMPTGLPGWFESLLAATVSVLGAGWPLAGSALALMVCVQCIDDIVDCNQDRASGARNFVHDLGPIETRFLATACPLFAVSLAPRLCLAVLIGMAIVDSLFCRLTAGPTPHVKHPGTGDNR